VACWWVGSMLREHFKFHGATWQCFMSYARLPYAPLSKTQHSANRAFVTSANTPGCHIVLWGFLLLSRQGLLPRTDTRTWQ
jgi:hypothetical protein